MKTLVVVAHMDDETFGLGGTLINMCRVEPKNVKIVSMCDGRFGENKQHRTSSFMKVMGHLGCEYFSYGMDDLSLETVRLDILSNCISDQVGNFCADVVICNSITDIHQDHVAVSRATRISCRPHSTRIKKLLEFKIPGSSRGSDFNIASNISDVIHDKLNLCEYYTTEIKSNRTHPCSIYGIKAINKSDGVEMGIHYAEMLRLVWSREI